MNVTPPLPLRHAALLAACDANTQAALGGMVAYAAEIKAKPPAAAEGGK